MSQEFGRIERPTAESFGESRKLFLVPLVYSPTEPPADYVAPLERYWAGARNQVRRLADRTGGLKHIYHDGTKRRTEHMIKRIEETLAAGESGILLIPEEHSLQFPRDIQVFYVAPP